MKLTHFLTAGILAGAMAAMPGLSLAAPAAQCAGAPAAASAASVHEVSALLDDVQLDAQTVALEADDLQSLLKGVNVSWESHATDLNRMRRRINDMGVKLCRLESLRGAAAPWQQKAIDATASRLRLMADNDVDAISFLNHNREELWMPQYAKYINNLSTESNEIAHSVRECQEYAKVHSQDLNLGKTLGIAAGQ